MAFETFLAAQAAYNEITAIQTQIDDLTATYSFEDMNVKMVNESRNLFTLPTVLEDFNALKTAMLDRLNTELESLTGAFETAYPCLVDE